MISSESFVALKHRNFRLIWIGLLLSFTGSMMQNAGLLWHVSLLVPNNKGLALGMVGLVKLVPTALREGALALGASRARAVWTVVLPAALPGIITGIVLALARIAGETAPLLFTSFNNRFFTTSLTQPISTLTVQVFTYAISPYEDWHRQAWAGALILVTGVFCVNVLVRIVTRVRTASA